MLLCSSHSCQKYQYTLGLKVKFSRGSDILSRCQVFFIELWHSFCVWVFVFVYVRGKDNVSSSTSASENLLCSYPVPVTDTMKAISEITKPHSSIKSRKRTSKSLLTIFPISKTWCAFVVNWWKPVWCNAVFIHDGTWWEGLAVNKSSTLTEEKSSNKKTFFLPDEWVTIQRKKRPRFSAVKHSDINFTGVKSQLTIQLIDEDYPARKEEAWWRDSSRPSVQVHCIFTTMPWRAE